MSSKPSGAGPGARAGAVRRLPGPLIDQIAAGEVVERPASVVKELVENALDAAARRVRVEVRDGGRAWICVSDDGRGMTPDDARMALERHATSKIVAAEDLARIHTYGFRGEALPAIASVSHLRLCTRPAGATAGFELQVESGRIVAAREAPASEGTRVEVAELFASVPARRKFLKKAATEWTHVAEWLARAALALPEVHFDLRRDDRPAVAWPACTDPLDRIAAVIGEEDAAAFVPVAGEEGGASLHGFVSRPDRHRPTLAGVHWFVNRRPVRDRLLRHALLEVYRDVLPRARFPAAVLFLEIPTDRVDVNVHPAKSEVRFDEPQGIHRLVRRAVRAAHEERRWMAVGAPSAEAPPGSAAPRSAPRHEAPETTLPVSGPGDWTFARTAIPPAAERPGELFVAEPEPGVPSRTRFGELRLVGQLLATYLALEAKEGLLLVDQHAAHERVLYERLRREWLERGVERQPLLVPATLRLDAPRLAALTAEPEVLERLGFEIEPFGEETLAIRAIPALLAGRDPAALARGLGDELLEAGRAADAVRVGARALETADRLFASLACHAARRKGEVLDPREQRALLDALDAIPWAPTCPHGRPVCVPFDLAEIERRFARR